MRTSRVKAKLAQNLPVLIPALHLTDPSLYELVSLLGFDAIWLDLEHHATSLESANNLMRAARVGSADILARPAKGELMRLGRLLEAGAQGIMYPRCQNAQEAAEVVRWAKFPPLGCRGFDGANPDMPYYAGSPTEYVRAANEETFVVIQVEDPQAVENSGQIARVPGVDVLFLGTADYSLACGLPGEFSHARVQDAIRSVAAAATTAGKHWGMPCSSAEHARELLAMGARFICHGCDIILLKEVFLDIQRRFSPLGFEFENRL